MSAKPEIEATNTTKKKNNFGKLFRKKYFVTNSSDEKNNPSKKQTQILNNSSNNPISTNLVEEHIETFKNNESTLEQNITDLTDPITKKNRLYTIYLPENLYKVVEKYVGRGIWNKMILNLEPGDVVGVIKKSDPSGNHSNWFIDDGVVKAIVPSSILKSYYEMNANECSNEAEEFSSSHNLNYSEFSINNKSIEFSKNEQIDIENHQGPNEIILKKDEYCIALYNFEAIDSATLTVEEGDKLKILQKHDDNYNYEWWLLEKSHDIGAFVHRGFVPYNYVEIISENTSV